ncbi:hypothetical protein PHYBOEH_011063 [Phytophthora boehmeriae]|uniref:RxLR effector protein n=1 Tax=Phytophthora boehmeriae TaxID=109152 RepID=A0A8T1X8T6_9STRA|nr:hypothetical protein PHYBOEH_011063 [Phytophthora boehmeriae]
MRLSFIALVAAFVLVATSEGVSGANSNEAKVSALSAADQNEAIDGRILKVDETEDEFNVTPEEEEKAFIVSIPGLSGIKEAVAKLKFRTWFSAKKTPTMVNAELSLATAQSGSINWAYAVGYARYWRNLMYGPYAVDKVIKAGSKDN